MLLQLEDRPRPARYLRLRRAVVLVRRGSSISAPVALCLFGVAGSAVPFQSGACRLLRGGRLLLRLFLIVDLCTTRVRPDPGYPSGSAPAASHPPTEPGRKAPRGRGLNELPKRAWGAGPSQCCAGWPGHGGAGPPTTTPAGPCSRADPTRSPPRLPGPAGPRLTPAWLSALHLSPAQSSPVSPSTHQLVEVADPPARSAPATAAAAWFRFRFRLQGLLAPLLPPQPPQRSPRHRAPSHRAHCACAPNVTGARRRPAPPAHAPCSTPPLTSRLPPRHISPFLPRVFRGARTPSLGPWRESTAMGHCPSSPCMHTGQLGPGGPLASPGRSLHPLRSHLGARCAPETFPRGAHPVCGGTAGARTWAGRLPSGGPNPTGAATRCQGMHADSRLPGGV